MAINWIRMRGTGPRTAIYVMDQVTVSQSSAAPSLVNRYGAPKRSLGKRGKVILWLTIAVLALAFTTWLAVGRGPSPVDSKVVGFSVTDATMSELDFQVTKDPSATAQCAAKAMNESYAVVGWDVVTIGPNGTAAGSDGGRTTAQRAMVRTDSLAVSLVVDSCWIVPSG